ncbi:MAG TPA: DUF2185 domain-containing protein [Kofleriaceae bacterium]|nr:DUF2185 domain-containing protein [Kofleriaceae bacterium]
MKRRKTYGLRPEQIVRLVPSMGGCIASDRITVDGKRVGSMYRERSVRDHDSGWVFLAGDETQAYMDDAEHFGVYDVNTIANYDRAVIPYLYALPGQRFDRDADTDRFAEAPDSEPDPEAAGLPPGIDVVQGHFHLTDTWAMHLPAPFRRRREGADLVLWRPALTFWISVFENATSPVGERVARLRAGFSPAASELRLEERGGLTVLSYRLVEDTTDARVPSLYTFVVGQSGHLQLGIYGDREDDIASARATVATVRER